MWKFQKVATLAEVPEQFKGMYTENEDKSFSVNPLLTGAVEAINGLNGSLVASRAEAKANKEAKIDISSLSDYGTTPEEIKDAVAAKVAELEGQIKLGGDAKVNIDKVRADLAEGYAKQTKAQQAKEEALTGQLYKMLVTNEATSAITEQKGVAKLVMPFIESQVRVVDEDGKHTVKVVDDAGDVRYSSVTGSPMSIKELVGELKSDEAYGRLFESETKPGGGMPPGGGSGTPKQPGQTMSSVDKINAGLSGIGKA